MTAFCEVQFCCDKERGYTRFDVGISGGAFESLTMPPTLTCFLTREIIHQVEVPL